MLGEWEYPLLSSSVLHLSLVIFPISQSDIFKLPHSPISTYMHTMYIHLHTHTCTHTHACMHTCAPNIMVSTSGLMSKNKNPLIIIHNCNAKIATSSRTTFYIEFFSTCAEGMTCTAANNDWKHVSGESDIWPVWKASDPLTSIRPIITEEAYLEQQHLLVMLKSQEGDEPYGEWRIVRVCIISIVNCVK